MQPHADRNTVHWRAGTADTADKLIRLRSIARREKFHLAFLRSLHYSCKLVEAVERRETRCILRLSLTYHHGIMGRRIPQSGKAKKEKLQIKRANTTAHAVRTLHPEEEAERLAAAATSRADAGRMQMTTRPGGGSTRGGDNVERSSGSRREAAAARSAGNGDSDERVSRKDVQLRLESRFLKLPLDLLNHHR